MDGIRDEFVLESLRQAMPMLVRIATRYNVDVEDLRQAAAVDALIWYERACKAENPRAYLHTVIRSAAMAYGTKSDFALSLDAPMSAENDTTFGDMLTAHLDDPQDFTDVDERSAILHQALRRLPLEEQMYMREVHHLNSFNPLPPDWKSKPNYNRSRLALCKGAYRRLRTDKELAQALGYA